MLQAQNMVNKINEAQQSSATDSGQVERVDELYVVGEAKAAMTDAQEMQANHADDFTLDRHIQMLNGDQEGIFTQVPDYLQHQYRHENEQYHCTAFGHCTYLLVVLEEQGNPSLFKPSRNR